MTIANLVFDKSIKEKGKVATLSKWLLDGSLSSEELIVFAEKSKGPVKATCIEAIELATRQNPEMADEHVFSFVTKGLNEKAPRVKWESAKVIGNIAHSHRSQLTRAIKSLLENAEHEGTVVRWASAYALGKILQLETDHNKSLLPAIEKCCEKELNSGVKKKYLEALKKLRN